MSAQQTISKETLGNGTTKLVASDCVFLYQRPRPGVLVVTIVGNDRGQFGTASLDEIRFEMLRHNPLELFFDVREVVGATVSVSDEWTRFFAGNHDRLKRVSVLVGSKVMYLTVAVAQVMSRTGNLIQIYSDAEIFASLTGIAPGSSASADAP